MQPWESDDTLLQGYQKDIYHCYVFDRLLKSMKDAKKISVTLVQRYCDYIEML